MMKTNEPRQKRERLLNKAYELFKDKDFPSINLGKTWQIAYIAYLKWKCDNNKKL